MNQRYLISHVIRLSYTLASLFVFPFANTQVEAQERIRIGISSVSPGFVPTIIDGGGEWHRCGEDVPWTYTIPFEMWGPRQLVAGMGRGLPNVWSERDTGAEAVLLTSKDGGKSWSVSFPKETLSSMIMAITFTSPQRDSVVVATGVTIGAGVNAKGEIYHVDLNDGHWQPLVKDLPGINFMMPA